MMSTTSASKIRKFPKSPNGRVCEYFGYVFTKDGQVFSPRGNLVEQLKDERGTGNSVTLIIKSPHRKLVRVNLARAIYSMFSDDELLDDEVVTFKNGNVYDCAIENLEKTKKSHYIKEKHKHVQKKGRKRKYTDQETEKILLFYDKNRNMQLCAKEFKCSIFTIRKIVSGNYFKKGDEKGEN